MFVCFSEEYLAIVEMNCGYQKNKNKEWLCYLESMIWTIIIVWNKDILFETNNIDQNIILEEAFM